MVSFAVLRTFHKEENELLQELEAGLFKSKMAKSRKKFKAPDRQIDRITDHGTVVSGTDNYCSSHDWFSVIKQL